MFNLIVYGFILRSSASLVNSVGSMVAPLTEWYWVRIPVGLALHLHSHLILVCVNYDLNGSLHINSRLHARLNNQISHPIPSSYSGHLHFIFLLVYGFEAFQCVSTNQTLPHQNLWNFRRSYDSLDHGPIVSFKIGTICRNYLFV